MEITAADLLKIPLFQGCKNEDLTSTAKAMKRKEFNADEFIVEQGQTASQMFCIVDGNVDVIVDGKTVDTIGSGSFFGELGLLYNFTRVASVKATAKSVIYVLEKEEFEIIKANTPEIIQKINEIASERMNKFKQRLGQNLDPNAFTESQKQEFKMFYNDIDTDNSGTIEIDELKQLLQKLNPEKKFTEEEINFGFAAMDLDGDGSIDFDEFLLGLQHIKQQVGL